MDLHTRVVSIVSELSGKEEVTVGMESRLGEDLDMDSLDLVELCLRLREEFGTEIPEDFEGDPTVRNVIHLVEQSLAKGAA